MASAEWASISGSISKKDMDILENKTYINCYRLKKDSMLEEIKHICEDITEINKKSTNLEHHLSQLKNQKDINNQKNTLYTRIYSHMKDQIMEKEEKNKSFKQHWENRVSDLTKMQQETELETQQVTPAYKPYKLQLIILQKILIKEKYMTQCIEYAKEQKQVQKNIQRDMFHIKIISFVKMVKNNWEITKMSKIVEDKTLEGQALLDIYQRKLADRKSNAQIRTSNLLRTFPPATNYERIPIQKPSPTLSTVSYKTGNNNYSINKRQIKEIKYREKERAQTYKNIEMNNFINPQDYKNMEVRTMTKNDQIKVQQNILLKPPDAQIRNKYRINLNHEVPPNKIIQESEKPLIKYMPTSEKLVKNIDSNPKPNLNLANNSMNMDQLNDFESAKYTSNKRGHDFIAPKISNISKSEHQFNKIDDFNKLQKQKFPKLNTHISLSEDRGFKIPNESQSQLDLMNLKIPTNEYDSLNSGRSSYFMNKQTFDDSVQNLNRYKLLEQDDPKCDSFNVSGDIPNLILSDEEKFEERDFQLSPFDETAIDTSNSDIHTEGFTMAHNYSLVGTSQFKF